MCLELEPDVVPAGHQHACDERCRGDEKAPRPPPQRPRSPHADGDAHVFQGIKAGATGYLPAFAPPEDLSCAIKTVHAGDNYRPRDSLQDAPGLRWRPTRNPPPPSSPNGMQIITSLANGNKQMFEPAISEKPSVTTSQTSTRSCTSTTELRPPFYAIRRPRGYRWTRDKLIAFLRRGRPGPEQNRTPHRELVRGGADCKRATGKLWHTSPVATRRTICDIFFDTVDYLQSPVMHAQKSRRSRCSTPRVSAGLHERRWCP